jgi:septal ring factor EnvC (AmiA/AmiB activator)
LIFKYQFRDNAPGYKNRTSGFTFTRNSRVTVYSGKPFSSQISAFRLLLMMALLMHPLASGQQKSRKQLEKERRENLRKIEQTREILQEVKKEKRSSLTQLRAIEEQEKIKEKTIGNIREELGILDSDMAHLQSEEEKLAYTLAVLKKEYAAMVYAASKAKKADFGFYLFASASAQQFFSRWQHLRHYASERRMQEKQIRELSLRLNQQKLKLAEVKQNKEMLLSQEQKERKQLQRLEEDKKQVVSQLSKKEQELKAKIKKHQEALRRLENLIASMVKKEIRKSRTGETGDKNKAAGSTSEMLLTPEGKLISSSFSGNRGRLPWPVQSGFISSGFGRQEHPVLKKVYIDNLGIDISTKAGSVVRSVFEGLVGLVGSVPGMDGQIVLIRHGDYFTVYSGLKNIRVSAGEKVKRMQAMGDVKSGEEGAVLQFQVWKNSKRLNPQSWLAPR